MDGWMTASVRIVSYRSAWFGLVWSGLSAQRHAANSDGATAFSRRQPRQVDSTQSPFHVGPRAAPLLLRAWAWACANVSAAGPAKSTLHCAGPRWGGPRHSLAHSLRHDASQIGPRPPTTVSAQLRPRQPCQPSPARFRTHTRTPSTQTNTRYSTYLPGRQSMPSAGVAPYHATLRYRCIPMIHGRPTTSCGLGLASSQRPAGEAQRRDGQSG